MNKILSLAFLILIAVASKAQSPSITFKDTMQYHMGTFKQGEVAEHVFEFTNTGNGVLKIKEVRTTCSCTASEWPKTAIAPGQKGSIKVTFDTHDKLGEYAKGVNIFSNAGESNLIIIVNVVKNDKPVPRPHKEIIDHSGHDHD
ncbi:MAG: DUF1573 domain-containing protein [Bacteroidia bacterium]|nr:DUF1573 domain-containing protein [Bacteroidia bacterium]